MVGDPLDESALERLRGKVAADGRGLVKEGEHGPWVYLLFSDGRSVCRLYLQKERYDFAAIKRLWEASCRA